MVKQNQKTVNKHIEETGREIPTLLLILLSDNYTVLEKPVHTISHLGKNNKQSHKSCSNT